MSEPEFDPTPEDLAEAAKPEHQVEVGFDTAAPDDIPTSAVALGDIPAGDARTPASLRTAAAWSWRIIAVAIVAAGAGWLALQFSALLIALMAALLFAVVLEPLSSWFKRKLGWAPALASATTIIILILVTVGLIAGAGTGLYQGFSDLSGRINDGVGQIIDYIQKGNLPIKTEDLDKYWENLVETAKNNSGQIFGGVMSVGSSVGRVATGAVLALFALFFFLKDGRRLWSWIVRLFPKAYRNEANESGIRAWVTVGNYTRTQVIVAAVDAVGIFLVALLLKTPLSLAFPIGVLVFLFSFIPILGALISGMVAVLVVLVNTGSPWMALAMLAGVLAVQQIEGNILQPVLQGNALNLHPLAIVLIVTGGSGVAGIIGALFSVPIAAAINTVVLYLRGHDTYPYLSKDKDRPGGPPIDFAISAEEHWKRFDSKVAQQISPREKRRQKWAARRGTKS